AVIAIILITIVLPIPLAPPHSPFPQSGQILRTAIVVLAFLTGAYCLLAWTYSAVSSAAAVMFTWLLLTWAVPIGFDMIRFSLGQFGEVTSIDGIASCSPVGALICIWDPQHRHVDT